MKRITGHYEKITTVGEAFNAFIPNPLPPDKPKFLLDKVTLGLLQKAEHGLASLELAGEMVPSLDWFIYAFVRKEAVTSSQIEGTQATLMDLLTFEAEEHSDKKDDADVEEICNYLEALKYARKEISRKNGLPLSMRLINEVHRRLMKGVRGSTKQPGEIRRSQNWIGGSRPGNAIYVPPPPHLLADTLSTFEKYIHASDDLPPLVRAGLLHVQFESIHPYLDGNGRIGRLLITLLLEHWKLISQPLLYLSLYFKRHRNEYYQRLGVVRAEGDWEGWISFFLQGIVTISSEAIHLARDLFVTVSKDREKILNSSQATVIALRLFELLPLHPIVTMPGVVKLLNTTKPTATKAIAVLEELGILSESSGRKRDRTFNYSAYLQKLRIGTELSAYRIVIEYAFRKLVIKPGKVVELDQANESFDYLAQSDAEVFFKKVILKLKNTPSVRGAILEHYNGFVWVPIKDQLLWSEDSAGVSTLHASDVVSDPVDSFLQLMKQAGL